MHLMRFLKAMLLWACLPLYFGNKTDHSKNQQTTHVNDSSLILANGGVAARDGGVVNITDGGAMKLATDLLSTSLGGVFGMGGQALDFAGRSNANALEFANQQGKASFGFGSEVAAGAFDLVGRSNANSLDFADRTNAGALDFAGRSNANALTYADNVLTSQSKGLEGFMDSFTSLLGFAGDTQATAQVATAANSALVSQAYQDATDSSTGNRTLLLVCVGVVGVVAFAMIFRKA